MVSANNGRFATATHKDPVVGKFLALMNKLTLLKFETLVSQANQLEIPIDVIPDIHQLIIKAAMAFRSYTLVIARFCKSLKQQYQITEDFVELLASWIGSELQEVIHMRKEIEDQLVQPQKKYNKYIEKKYMMFSLISFLFHLEQQKICSGDCLADNFALVSGDDPVHVETMCFYLTLAASEIKAANRYEVVDMAVDLLENVHLESVHGRLKFIVTETIAISRDDWRQPARGAIVCVDTSSSDKKMEIL